MGAFVLARRRDVKASATREDPLLRSRELLRVKMTFLVQLGELTKFVGEIHIRLSQALDSSLNLRGLSSTLRFYFASVSATDALCMILLTLLKNLLPKKQIDLNSVYD